MADQPPRGLFESIIIESSESIDIDRGTTIRLADHIRRSNIGLEAAGMETLNMPEDMSIVLAALIDRALTESERDDGLWWSLRTAQLLPLPRPTPTPIRWRARRGLRLLWRELRDR